jgi:rRNA small subunit pseudouridine methyltransferase Nep1
MLKIIIAEAEIEPMPRSLRSLPVMKKKYGKKDVVLLDSNYHHTSMQSLPEAYRRGRPDIAHICLLNALESPLNKDGGLEVYVHTRDDKVIYIDHSWKVPKSYNRFVGLIEQLFSKRRITADGTDLLRMENKRLTDLISEVAGDMPVKVMHYKGEAYEPDSDEVLIIGGFPHGDFSNELPYPRYTIHGDELVAWAVLNHVVYGAHRT